MIKYVFSDMDGTLLTPEGKLPDGLDKMLADLKARGCTFVPASGRQYYSLLNTFDKYKDDMLFMAENGTLIKDGQGKEYFADHMPAANVQLILDKCRELDHPYPVLCGRKSVYIERRWEKYLDECLKYFLRYEFIDDYDDFKNIDDDIVKFAIADCDHLDAENMIYNPLQESLGDRVQVVLSSDLWVDVMNNGSGKGNAVTEFCKKMGISTDECAAFGDYLNDYTMMQSVKYSYAMENAYPELKKVASGIAKSNAEFGVVKKVYELMAKGLI